MSKLLKILLIIPIAFSFFAIREADAQAASSEIDLIWEASSYTPPFYKGKAVYPYQGNLKIVAVPNIVRGGNRIGQNSLKFTWKRDGQVIGSASGLGRNSITIDGSVVIRPINISVTVTAPDGYAAYKNMSLSPSSPTAVLYENNPMLGVLYNKALPNIFSLKEKEVRITAVPYYFSTIAPNGLPLASYKWGINGVSADASEDAPHSLVLRKPDSATGQSIISVNVTNSSQILQFADSGIVIEF